WLDVVWSCVDTRPYSTHHFSDERALNSLHFLKSASAGFLRTPLLHPHLLRHACGFKLANDGHDTRALQHYLGHKSIQHTVQYTEMGAGPVQGLLERLTLALGILVPPLPGAGKLGTTSASPSITLAFAAASRLAIISLMNSIERSICSVVMSLITLLCSTLCSRGTSRARILR